VRQHVPEHAGEAQGHGFGARRVADDQIGDRVQGIKQEVRIDLGPKSAKLGFRHLLEEQRFAALALDGLLLAAERIQAIAALGGHRAQVVQVMCDQSRAGRTRRDQQ
jgi:hypothetical protein